MHQRYWQTSLLDSAPAAVSCKTLGRWLPFLLQLPHLQTENEKTCPTTGENDYKDQMQLYWYKVLSSHYVLGTLQGPLVSKERAFKDQVDGVTGCGEFPTMSWNPHPMSRWLSKRRVGEWGAFCRRSTEAHRLSCCSPGQYFAYLLQSCPATLVISSIWHVILVEFDVSLAHQIPRLWEKTDTLTGLSTCLPDLPVFSVATSAPMLSYHPGPPLLPYLLHSHHLKSRCFLVLLAVGNSVALAVGFPVLPL